MDAGKLDRLVTIKSRDTGQDAMGQPSTSWVLVSAVWASIKYLSGIGAIRSDADTSIVKASIRVRYRVDIEAGMRVEYGLDVFNVVATLPVGRNDYLDLVCERVQ